MKKQPISRNKAAKIDKVQISATNIGASGLLGCRIVKKYQCADGRILVEDSSNGGDEWYFEKAGK